MSKLVQFKDFTVVNMDKVCAIYWMDDISKMKICFEFDSMSDGEFHEAVWVFKSDEEKKIFFR